MQSFLHEFGEITMGHLFMDKEKVFIEILYFLLKFLSMKRFYVAASLLIFRCVFQKFHYQEQLKIENAALHRFRVSRYSK